MATDNELQRLAAAVNQLRPEWPVASLLTFLRNRHHTRPYRDLIVALGWIASDPTTQTPARLSEAGPWWTATSMTESAGPTQSTMRCPEHERHHAGNCPECVALAVPKPEGFVIPKPRKQHPPSKPQTADEEEAARLKAIREHIDAQTAQAS